MTYPEAVDMLLRRTTGEMREAVVVLIDYVNVIEQRYGDKEAVRLGHIVQALNLTPEQFYAAETAARVMHPDAWEGRHPIAQKEGI